MSRSIFLVAVVGLASPRMVVADPDPDPLYTCKAPSAATKISVTFQPETSLKDLATWALGFTCKNIVFSSDVAKYSTRVTVIAPKPMSPKQATQLFIDSVEAAGLVVVQKPDTFIIKAGPNMQRGCADTEAKLQRMEEREQESVARMEEMRSSIAKTPLNDKTEREAEAVDAIIDQGIRKIDDSSVVVTRAVVDAVLLAPMAVAKGARVVPAMKNGQVVGFKLYAIRPSSIYAKLGFTNGDTVQSINGFALTSADKALEVYTKVREATSIEIEIERRGKPRTLRIEIKAKL